MRETWRGCLRGTPEQFTAFTLAEAAKRAKVVKDSGATVD